MYNAGNRVQILIVVWTSLEFHSGTVFLRKLPLLVVVSDAYWPPCVLLAWLYSMGSPLFPLAERGRNFLPLERGHACLFGTRRDYERDSHNLSNPIQKVFRYLQAYHNSKPLQNNKELQDLRENEQRFRNRSTETRSAIRLLSRFLEITPPWKYVFARFTARSEEERHASRTQPFQPHPFGGLYVRKTGRRISGHHRKPCVGWHNRHSSRETSILAMHRSGELGDDRCVSQMWCILFIFSTLQYIGTLGSRAAGKPR